MSELGRPFLHPDVRRLIEADRAAPDPPGVVKRKVAQQIDRSLGLAGGMLASLPDLFVEPPPLPTTRSRFPSRLKSPTENAEGSCPTRYLAPARNVPSPLPRNMETLLAAAELFATARPLFPSWLKSPTATAAGSNPVR